MTMLLSDHEASIGDDLPTLRQPVIAFLDQFAPPAHPPIHYVGLLSV
ncbi:MAG: hypothetical protein NT075_15255 [Chloroflexi bacterium]|nr:hypothetical protein [Chloroflexota bacterium]